MDCRVTTGIHEWFINRYLNIPTDIQYQRNIFWSGKFHGNEHFNIFGFSWAIIVQWLIWDMKTQKRVLQPLTLNENLVFLVANCLRVSPKLRHSMGIFRLLKYEPFQWRI
jgi:hypothetical protein